MVHIMPEPMKTVSGLTPPDGAHPAFADRVRAGSHSQTELSGPSRCPSGDLVERQRPPAHGRRLCRESEQA
jgi:hypothetical protein